MAKKAASAANVVSGFDVLIDPAAIEPAAVCAIVGDDGFLQHEVRRALVTRLSDGAADAVAEIFDGDETRLREVLDALDERMLFGGTRRIVVVADADDFVSEYRPQLEEYVSRPSQGATLVLEVSTWPANTRLAKAVAASGLTVRCARPEKNPELGAYLRKLKEWLGKMVRRDFDVELQSSAVDELLELAPTEPGILYQEVGRLALVSKGTIDPTLVREHVGGWRTQKTWDMIDAAADGRAAEALLQLDRLLAAGEDPHGLLPQLASTLRRFAMAVRLYDAAEREGRKPALGGVLKEAGMMPFKLRDGERQLMQIGRPRARQLYRWLLDADMDIKGHNSQRDRARRVVETLILRLSGQAREDVPAPARSGR